MLNASQKRMKRAALVDALMSIAPASTLGWLPTIPIGWPPSRPKPTTMFCAKKGWTSRKRRSSTSRTITSRMS